MWLAFDVSSECNSGEILYQLPVHLQITANMIGMNVPLAERVESSRFFSEKHA